MREVTVCATAVLTDKQIRANAWIFRVDLIEQEPALNSAGTINYWTLFIHLRIGPVTLVSAVSGDITSEMWLWSLYMA
jgi:hypothetical protein